MSVKQMRFYSLDIVSEEKPGHIKPRLKPDMWHHEKKRKTKKNSESGEVGVSGEVKLSLILCPCNVNRTVCRLGLAIR